MEVIAHNSNDLEQEARRLVKILTPQEERALLITLSGELGAGKTALTKALAKALGVEEMVNSPTFVLEKIYALPEGAFKRLVHIDAYRLETGEELSALGFDESMTDTGNLVVLEWPEKVRERLPKPDIAITIEVLPEGIRRITYA